MEECFQRGQGIEVKALWTRWTGLPARDGQQSPHQALHLFGNCAGLIRPELDTGCLKRPHDEGFGPFCGTQLLKQLCANQLSPLREGALLIGLVDGTACPTGCTIAPGCLTLSTEPVGEQSDQQRSEARVCQGGAGDPGQQARVPQP